MERRLAESVAVRLARRSSRRQFLHLSGSAALGTGLALTFSGVSLASTLAPCYSCQGGSGPCVSSAPRCAQCRSGCLGGGCAAGYDGRGSWYACVNGCQVRCTECCKPGVGGCHCFTYTGRECQQGGNCFCQ